MASEAGKGDKRRKGDNQAFDSNYDLAFGNKKPTRGSFIWDSSQGKMVSKDEYYANQQKSDSHMIIADIQPYQSQITGEMIMSRSKHREHLRKHGMIEVGNEVKHMINMKPEQKKDNLKEQIARQIYDKFR
ncbi:MAG: hypothetical protein PHT07_20670 [Paludibacter sp.]|nr:hypothetical protein [Paludibacter sp.]